MYTEDEYLMLSGIQHFSFCRRQWALIHIEQQWHDNYKTTSGELMHKKAHDEEAFEKRGDILIARGLRVASAELGVSGQCDVVEFHRSESGVNVFGYEGKWDVVPIEYKNGLPKDGKEDELQICAQAMCLEEMFQTKVKEGYLYYGTQRRRMQILFTDELKDNVQKCCEEMHQLFRKGYTPKCKYAKRCKACSLIDLCVPKLQSQSDVREYMNNFIGM